MHLMLCFAKIHFCIKYIFASNAFLHQMHFCIKYIFASNTFLQSKASHFVGAKMLCFLLCKKQRCCPYILLVRCKNAFFHQMHLMQKCIWCKNAFWRTFSKGKCSAVQKCIFASHFPKENVQLCKNAFDAKMHLMPKCILATQRITFSKGKCSANQNVRKRQNAFDAYILFCWTFSFGKCTPKCIFASNAFLHQQNVTNAFDAALTFCLQNVRKRQNAFWRTFSKGKCSAVQKCICNILLMQKCIWCKNAFWRTFSKGKCSAKQNVRITFDFVKCSASHFPKENVQQSKMLQMHLMQKCIWCKNVFLRTFSKGKCSISNAFLQNEC